MNKFVFQRPTLQNPKSEANIELGNRNLEGTTRYTSCRPLKVYRVRGAGGMCTQNTCANNTVPYYGIMKKMTKARCSPTCDPSSGPVGSKRGNVMSFSGAAKLRSGMADLNPNAYPNTAPYYSNYAQYMRSRTNTFVANSVIHPIQGVKYAENDHIVWPIVNQGPTAEIDCQLNSAYYLSNIPGQPPELVVYKPNNVGYSVQGAVSSGARVDRLKYDAGLCCVSKKPKYSIECKKSKRTKC
jgi:hypothetical protein